MHQLEPNRRARVSWSRTGGPRQLESNRRSSATTPPSRNRLPGPGSVFLMWAIDTLAHHPPSLPVYGQVTHLPIGTRLSGDGRLRFDPESDPESSADGDGTIVPVRAAGSEPGGI